jgi:hypothetical protein
LPRMSYMDTTNHHLKFARCTTSTCSSVNTTTVDSSTDLTDFKNSLVVGNDGFGRIVVYDNTANTIKFIHCTNADCTTKNENTLDPSTDPLVNPSIALGNDGYARVAYYDSTTTAIKYAQCTNDDCTTSNITTVDNGGTNDVGDRNSITVDSADGFARILYLDSTASSYKVAQCTNAACTTSNISTVDAGVSGGVGVSSIVMGADHNPRLAYAFSSPTALRFTRCTNASCSTVSSTTIDNGSGPAVSPSSIDMGSDGFARLAYVSGSAVKYVTCTDANCTTPSITTVSGSNTLGNDQPAVKLFGGVPGIVYANNGSSLFYAYPSLNFKLRFAQSSSCASASYSDVTSSSAISYYNNPTPASNANISSTVSDPTDAGQSVNPQTYQESNSFDNLQSTFGGTVDSEWDFSLYDNGAAAGTSYCFKITQTDGTDLSAYTNYPTIITNTPGPTMDQVMRGGAWFNNAGVKQSYFWAQ